jgi:hypothetical protein
VWHWIHFTVTLATLIYTFSIIGDHPFSSILSMGIIIVLSVYINTSGMDGEVLHALAGEAIRLIFLLSLFYTSGSVLGLALFWPLSFTIISITFSLFRR